jgi:CDP-glucose 4,6-dehydratase
MVTHPGNPGDPLISRDLSFYRGKKVFLTGHTGFKGGWLASWLDRLGAQVHGFSLAPGTSPNFFDSVGLVDRVENEFGDVCDLNILKASIQRFEPDMVFHLAAQPLVRLSYQEPVETFETNVMGTVKVLEAVRSCQSVKACVMITSDKCYQNNEWIYSYRENDPLGGHDPYSASKGAAEIVINSYRSSFFNNRTKRQKGCGIASARAGNVIGGGDWSNDRIIPDSIRSLNEFKPVIVRNPFAVRPWQHVLEPLYGYLSLGRSLATDPSGFDSAWNFGPVSSNVNVRSLVDMVIREWGSGTWHDASTADSSHEAHYLRLDSTKSENLLSWRGVLTVKEAVGLTVAWYKEFYAGRDMAQVTAAQIAKYEEMASVPNHD